jgi:integrase
MTNPKPHRNYEPWNKGKLTGPKMPLKLQEIWTIRTHLQLADRRRDLAMFNLALDSKLRGCDLTKLRVKDITQGQDVLSRATVMQQKTQRPVQFELTAITREAVAKWIAQEALSPEDHLFPGRRGASEHLSTRQYARIVDDWCRQAGLDLTGYGTHSLRRTKATLIYRRTKNIRAIQILLGHSKLENTVRYLGIDVNEALEISEQTEI